MIDFLFIEPQTQLQVIRIEGTRFETESGIKAQIADTNSIIGRVGFRAGSNFSFGSAERISTAYIYGDVLREFKEITSSLPEAIPRLSTSHTPTKKLGMTPVLAPTCL